MKNSNDPIGNRTRDFPACGAVSKRICSVLSTRGNYLFLGCNAMLIGNVVGVSAELAASICIVFQE
jgi:hypothetical protein